MIPVYGFDWHFHLVISAPFHLPIGQMYVSSEKMSIKVLCLFLNWVVFVSVFTVEQYEFLVYLYMNFLWPCDLQIFSSFPLVAFSLRQLFSFLCSSFLVGGILHIYLFFVACAFGITAKQTTAKICIKELTFYVFV